MDYELRFTALVGLSLGFPAFAAASLLDMWIGGEPYRMETLAWPGAGWLWIVGGNYLLCSVWFHRWLKRGLRGLASQPRGSRCDPAVVGS